MKRVIFTFALALFCVYAVSAQDFTSKKGIPILPEQGDMGLSIDAVPFFEYLGNMFHGSNATAAPTFDFPGLGGDIPQWTLQVRKFKSATMAYRARVRLGFWSNTLKNTILDESNTGTTPAYVDDKWNETRMNVVLGLGLEKRRGKGRVQGYYGAMVNLMVMTHTNKVTYGNSMNSTHPDPLSTVYPWTEAFGSGYETENASSRVIKDNDGLGFGIGANVFLGVEYFFAPKMSIGGEFSFGLLFSMTGKSKTEVESWDGTGITTSSYKYGGTTFFGIDNSNTGGALNLNFYF
jgi:hypothetical protein